MRVTVAMVVTILIGLGAFWPAGSAMAATREGRLAIAPVSGRGLVIAAADGRGAHRVCVAGRCIRVADPHWSADGREFVFSAASPCGNAGCRRVVVVGAPDGTCVDCNGNGPLGAGGDPTFQGDRGLIDTVASGKLRVSTLMGRRYAVLAHGGVLAGALSRRGTIALARRDGIWVGPPGHLRRIAAGSDPAWSVSGSWLAFVRSGWITIARARGGPFRKLARGADPSWSPDGRRIAYVGPGRRIMEVSIASRRTHRVGNLRGRQVAWGTTPRPPRCLTPIGMHPLTADAGGSLYEAYVRAGLGQTLVGCLASQGVARVLTTLGVGTEDDADHLQQVLVDGRFAAVLTHEVDQHYVTESQLVTVYDLRTGRPAPMLGGEMAFAPNADESPFSLNDLVLNGSGETAVHAITTYPGTSPGTYYDIESILASTGSGVQTIATAAANPTDTTLADLNLTGTVLSYTDNGTPESTELP